MDFMKVLDQTVREIKREVNLKVLKVPEIEQKVGVVLLRILPSILKFMVYRFFFYLFGIWSRGFLLNGSGECAMIMNVLWQRLGDTSANWRHVYKALAVVEYLLANGTDRAVDAIIDNSSQIAYVEPNGKDVGLNVRKKAENVLAVVDDREKLKQVREKAAATRDKYFGLSSTGVTYKSSAASFGSGSYSSGSRYGITQSSKEADTFRDSYRGKEWGNSSKETNSGFRSTRQMSIGNTGSTTNYKSRKGEGHRRRNQDSSTSHLKSSSNLRPTSGGTSSQEVDNEYDDDFNPRGSSTSGTANASYNHVDLFGQSLMDDLVDTTTSTSRVLPNVGTASLPEVDLFANTDFQSANAPLESATCSHAQDNIDLFADRSSFAGSVNSDTEFSVRGSPNKSSELNLSSLAHSSASAFDPFQPSFATSFPSDTEFSVHDTPSKSKTPTHQHSSSADFDPFAAIRAKTLDGSDSFSAFSSNMDSCQIKMESAKSSDHSPLEELDFGAFTSHTESPRASATKPMSKSPTKLESPSMSESKPEVKKGAFQVKSGIWADSLSRGLINLNITASKKVDVPDAGVVGQLSDGSEDKDPAVPWRTGTTMGTGSGLQGMSGFPASAGSAVGSRNFQQQQFGSFK
ncbi:Clathrin interactor EPSIN 1 [Dichanthelium oligosanthes]|uniref:Clathrin interactor EPSIN 1 n=1 Tax=Dichanthelium oligosanthes TaxID=888268 RepID=A0A1E5WCL0_9POAL|nr:Clathrin interactor EPSIN 1 [Dichanthelium oligosanthes]